MAIDIQQTHSSRVLDRETPVYIAIPWLERAMRRQPLLRGKAYQIAKRISDVTLVLVTMPLWLPLMALVAVLVKLDSPGGPVVYRQLRTGKGGNRFAMFKFRTMVENADELKEQLADLNELQWPDFKITNDPRITRVGGILRKTSLDELPQLINVLLGDMSLVGPRPTSFSAKTYALWHTERLDVLPGIAGLWQIIGRGSTEFDERLRLDIAYMNNRGLLFDFEILVRTVLAVVQRKGAM